MWKGIAARWQHASHLVRLGWLIAMGLVGAIGTVQTVWPALPAAVTRGYELILPPLTWQVWALLVAALLIGGMFEGSFRHGRALQSEIDGLKGYLESYSQAFSAQMGDVPIEDVFYWIDLMVVQDNTWEEIGANLLDRLHLGQIKAWGRPVDAQGRRGVLTEISPIHWSRLKFNYMWFMPRAVPDDVHTSNMAQAGVQYAGLLFNADQIEAFWPRP